MNLRRQRTRDPLQQFDFRICPAWQTSRLSSASNDSLACFERSKRPNMCAHTASRPKQLGSKPAYISSTKNTPAPLLGHSLLDALVLAYLEINASTQ